FYNDIVMRYNTRRETFPNVIVAGLFGFEEAEYFGLGAREALRSPGVRKSHTGRAKR
ncbi:MAG TPA: hypothetical protein ENO08_06550, partial [Candidatus Eisenbacteria bacterium]|nr:hypothetical protein [Candidatus Eisenbacteria bacterium]